MRLIMLLFVALPALALADKENTVQANMRRIALSSEICLGQASRAEALTAIARERHYSSIGGVVKLKTMASLQDDVRSADERIALAKNTLRVERASAIPCKNQSLRAIVECRARQEKTDDDPGNTNSDDVCSDSNIRYLLGVINEYTQSLKEQ